MRATYRATSRGAPFSQSRENTLEVPLMLSHFPRIVLNTDYGILAEQFWRVVAVDGK